MAKPLRRLVLFSSVMVAGTCPLLYYLLQKGLSRTSYYQMALEQLYSHPEALDALGTPLSVRYLRLGSKHNLVDMADAQLEIPISGSKSEGYLYTRSTRNAPFERWHLKEVILELKGGQQIPVFSEESSDEIKEQ